MGPAIKKTFINLIRYLHAPGRWHGTATSVHVILPLFQYHPESEFSAVLIGPLFQYHPESEFSAVWFPMSSRLAANSLAISFGVLSPSAL
jgi:hypothetical protein